jgi:LPS-assembly lipoprotein
MSWSSPPRRTGRRAALALLAAIATTGCAFRPVYGGGDALAVAVAQPEGRSGYYYAARLRRRAGDAAAPTLRVDTALDLRGEGLAIAQDDAITRFNVIGRAVYTVVRLSDGAVLHRGDARSVSAYDATASQFATRAARQDAERRVAEDLAERVFASLAALRARLDDDAAAG